jgi:hypothetical protein
MLDDPRRHFVARRTKEIDRLADAPMDMRPNLYISGLTSSIEKMERAIGVEPGLKTHANRLIGWQRAFSEQASSDRHRRDITRARAPNSRRLRPTDRPQLVSDVATVRKGDGIGLHDHLSP